MHDKLSDEKMEKMHTDKKRNWNILDEELEQQQQKIRSASIDELGVK